MDIVGESLNRQEWATDDFIALSPGALLSTLNLGSTGNDDPPKVLLWISRC
jgi:hypothetical protein